MRAELMRLFAVIGIVTLASCGTQTGYDKAFSEKSALSGNSQVFGASSDQTFRTAKITLVQQGFTIEQVDVATGLIKAVRSLQDPQKPKYAYLITATVDVTGESSGKSTTITMAASQQTILHKDSEKYFHLLGLVPIPTGRNYQTVVTKEGNIDTAGFYKDFFAAIDKNLRAAAVAAATSPPAVTVSALPATGAAALHVETSTESSAPPAAAAPVAAVPAAALAVTTEPVAAVQPATAPVLVPAATADVAAPPAKPVPTPTAAARAATESTALAPLDP
ncbi:MAG TPA: hypothetical protein VF848_06570 [Steroidobacteraceae bacterium]